MTLYESGLEDRAAVWVQLATSVGRLHVTPPTGRRLAGAPRLGRVAARRPLLPGGCPAAARLGERRLVCATVRGAAAGRPCPVAVRDGRPAGPVRCLSVHQRNDSVRSAGSGSRGRSQTRLSQPVSLSLSPLPVCLLYLLWHLPPCPRLRRARTLHLLSVSFTLPFLTFLPNCLPSLYCESRWPVPVLC